MRDGGVSLTAAAAATTSATGPRADSDAPTDARGQHPPTVVSDRWCERGKINAAVNGLQNERTNEFFVFFFVSKKTETNGTTNGSGGRRSESSRDEKDRADGECEKGRAESGPERQKTRTGTDVGGGKRGRHTAQTELARDDRDGGVGGGRVLREYSRRALVCVRLCVVRVCVRTCTRTSCCAGRSTRGDAADLCSAKVFGGWVGGGQTFF